MEVRPGYKQTEVGVIPEEWDVDRLLRLCDSTILQDIVDGPLARISRQSLPHVGIPIVASGNVNEGDFDADDYRYVETSASRWNERRRLTQVTSVIGQVGAALAR